MKSWRTFEGIPISEYRLVPLLLSIPFSIAFELLFFLLRLTKRKAETVLEAPPPRNAISVCLHQEFPIFPYDHGAWTEMIRHCPKGGLYLGLHSWVSYVPSIVMNGVYRWECIRFDRRRDAKPLEKVLKILRENPDRPFALRTDSGGPYGVVRRSVVDMAIATGRPLVCFRQFVDRALILKGHKYPLPFASVRSAVSAPISAETLAALPKAEALALVQSEMDRLVKYAL